MTFPRLVLYHLCEKSLYDEALKSQKDYFPPTFDQEKFTHTTSDPELLLPIANEFYQGIKGDFILLWIDQEKIKQEALGDKISKYVVNRGWKQVEGGEYDKKWVNNAYKDRLFDSGALVLKSGRRVYFPIEGLNNDELGLCCCGVVSNGGAHLDIHPNRWRKPESTRSGRRRVKYLEYLSMRKKKKEKFMREAEKAKKKKN